ncbi:MAG: universal stress protein [Solirubrobacteraceae bacterium]
MLVILVLLMPAHRTAHWLSSPAQRAKLPLASTKRAERPAREKTMFKNVLVGVDGGPGGRDAIALALHLTEPDGGMTLAHVHGGSPQPADAPGAEGHPEQREASAKLLADEQASTAVTAELVGVQAPNPGRGLHEQAERQHADLLVVGSSARGALGRAMLGDDTRAALNGASCAVAVAPSGYAERPTPFAKIGVAYNTSPESEAALALAHTLATATRANVQVLEVVTIPAVSYAGIVPPAIGESLDLMLDDANRRLKELPDADGRAVYGLAGEELAAFSHEVDLLIVGSRGYGPWKRLVLGSTSDYLARHAHCPLLVLPRSRATADGGAAAGGTEHTEASHAPS